jgi:hypothetical protein
MTKPNSNPILNSPKLTALLEDRDKLKAKAEHCRAEVWRMTQIVSPQFHDATVRTVINEKDEAAQKKAVVSTGINNEQDEAARKKDALERTLKGEPIADSTSTKEKLENEHRQWAAYESAIEHLNREIDRERTTLSIQYCKEQRPRYDDLVKKVCKPMLELHAAWSELNDLKRHLIDNSIGLHGLCLTMPDFLSTPNNPHSEMADFFRAVKREKYINSIPKEYQL